jgi:phytoene dehydrogenase-like protein
MCVADWLNEWFETDLLKALLAGPALTGLFTGPWSAGTTATLLLNECLAGPGVKGGPAALIAALATACQEYGVEIRTACPVQRIRVADGRVSGVTLAGGQTIETTTVASSCEPKRTLLELVAPTDLPLRVEKQIRVYRTRGTTAKVNLALKALPEFIGRPGQQFEVIRIAGSLADLERAFDAVKYRRFSPTPYLDIRIPSLADTSLAPAGHHVASILVQCAPYDLEGGWSEAEREVLGETVVATLDRYAPCLTERIVAREVLTPVDLEVRYGLTGGHVHHGEHGLDQMLFMRPALSCGRYATPLAGLFLCGSGSHPGGGITCGPGALAAKAILKG